MGGRPWVSDEMSLKGILFVLRMGIPGKVATELGFVSSI